MIVFCHKDYFICHLYFLIISDIKPASIAPAPIQAKPIAPMNVSSSAAQQVKITMPLNHTQVTKAQHLSW